MTGQLARSQVCGITNVEVIGIETESRFETLGSVISTLGTYMFDMLAASKFKIMI